MYAYDMYNMYVLIVTSTNIMVAISGKYLYSFVAMIQFVVVFEWSSQSSDDDMLKYVCGTAAWYIDK